MVNLTQVEAGTLAYIDKEIMAKASPVQKFTLGTAVALATPRFENLYGTLVQHPIAKSLGVVDEDGFVDLDALYNAAKAAYRKSGSISFMGIVFDEKDIDKLYEHINSVK